METRDQHRETSRPPFVGLVPAAGEGTRLGTLGFSKEIYPIGGRRLGGPSRNGSTPDSPKVICEYLLEYYGQAGITRVCVIARPGKEDIRAHLDGLPDLNLDISYLSVADSRAVPETLDTAFHFSGDSRVALGFPDIIINPPGAFGDIISRQDLTGADIVLGLFPTDQDYRSDMVELDHAGKPKQILIKQPPQGLKYSWMIAVWTAAFTRYLHDAVAEWKESRAEQELQIGAVIQSAIDDGLHVDAVAFPKGDAIDIGTPEGLLEAKNRLAAD